MTLDLNFWLMLCSREEFSFRNVLYKHVGTCRHQIDTQVIQEIPIRNAVLGRYCKSKRNFLKFVSVFISHSLFKCFQQLLFFFFILVTEQSLHYGFVFRISSKMFFTSAGLKNGRHASTNVAIDHS